MKTRERRFCPVVKTEFNNKYWLSEQYSKENKSLRGIAKIVGVSKCTISKWMDKHGIPKRDKKTALSMASKKIVRKKGEEHHRFKNAKFITPSGYVAIYVNGQTRLEHRVIMEKHLGRKLKEDEHVHHLNHVKTDNRIENLEIVDPVSHQRIHNELDIPKDKLIEMLSVGMSVKEISEFFGCHYQTIKKRIVKYKINH
jgi:transposase